MTNDSVTQFNTIVGDTCDESKIDFICIPRMPPRAIVLQSQAYFTQIVRKENERKKRRQGDKSSEEDGYQTEALTKIAALQIEGVLQGEDLHLQSLLEV